jgi:hypothetical protein
MSKGELPADPRGLILEAYRMDIGTKDCRTIFFDWALGHPGPAGAHEIAALLAHYGPLHPDHPLPAVRRAGLQQAPAPRRRGRRGRDAARD